MSTVPDVGVCCKVTLTRDHGQPLTRYVEDGTIGEVITDALRESGLFFMDADSFSITVKREGHDA